MIAIARQYARDLLWLAVGYLVILEAAMIAAILYWPKFRDNTPAIAKLVPFQSLQDLLAAIVKIEVFYLDSCSSGQLSPLDRHWWLFC